MKIKRVTIENLADCTEQEVFDFVGQHLVKQGRVSVSADDGVCLYRGEDGLKCAAGAIIPDELYTAEIEGQDWHGATNLMVWTTRHDRMMMELQEIHDAMGPQSDERWRSWVEELNDLARARGLTPRTKEEFLAMEVEA